jgi:hypothetical protein
MSTDPSTAQVDNSAMTWTDYLATSLNLFGLSILFIFASLAIGVIDTGSSIWGWLMDQCNATET